MWVVCFTCIVSLFISLGLVVCLHKVIETAEGVLQFFCFNVQLFVLHQLFGMLMRFLGLRTRSHINRKFHTLFGNARRHAQVLSALSSSCVPSQASGLRLSVAEPSPAAPVAPANAHVRGAGGRAFAAQRSDKRNGQNPHGTTNNSRPVAANARYLLVYERLCYWKLLPLCFFFIAWILIVALYTYRTQNVIRFEL